MTQHFFGGDWTEVKLHILKYYIGVYTNALQGKFTLRYIDACAGTGARHEKEAALPVIGIEETIKELDGSARIALQVVPPFDHYLFIDKKKKHCRALEQLKDEFRDSHIDVVHGDANKVIQDEMQSTNWKTVGVRGVIFLDPYGLEIDWKTLEAISASKVFDVWFLMSVSGVNRNTSKSLDHTEDYKIEKLNRFFGTSSWQEAFFGSARVQPGLFDTPRDIQIMQKKATIKSIEEWTKKHLESIFSYVAQPVKLPLSGAQLFSLFFCLSNDSNAAIKLAKKISGYALNNIPPI